METTKLTGRLTSQRRYLGSQDDTAWQAGSEVSSAKEEISGCPKLGCHFGGPHSKDYSILGSILRKPQNGP